MSTLRVNSLLNAAGTDTPAIDGLAKAWVNFNGTGTVAIRESFNVSSITDNGTGDYTVNFTTALSDANYSAVSTIGYLSESSYGFVQMPWSTAPTTTAIRMACLNYNSGVAYDHLYVSVAVFR